MVLNDEGSVKMVFCTNCGADVESGETCPHCGAQIYNLPQGTLDAGAPNQTPGPAPQYYDQSQPPPGQPGPVYPPGYGVEPPKKKFPIWIFVVIGIVVVIAIGAIITAIAVPVYMNARSNAQRRTCQSNLRTIDGAIQSYEAIFDDPTYPTSLEDMTMPGTKTLKSIPTCPCGGEYVFEEGRPPYVSCPNEADHNIGVNPYR